jgi:hypothetical protein
MNHKKLFTLLLLLLTATTAIKCMEAEEQKKVKQLTLINPFFHKNKPITQLIERMDFIENKGLSYPDYDKRTGLMFTEFEVNITRDKKLEKLGIAPELTLEELQTRPVRVLVNEQLEDHYAQSPFHYPEVKNILKKRILPTTLQSIIENKWAELPKKLIAGFYLQRCHNGDPMDWHQDPGEYYDPQANFSLVLMLGEQTDPQHGWTGGEFKVKPGLPKDDHREADVKTIIHEYNQGVLFNNQINSHAVTEVLANTPKSKRDIVVLTLYFGKRSVPIAKTTDK